MGVICCYVTMRRKALSLLLPSAHDLAAATHTAGAPYLNLVAARQSSYSLKLFPRCIPYDRQPTFILELLSRPFHSLMYCTTLSELTKRRRHSMDNILAANTILAYLMHSCTDPSHCETLIRKDKPPQLRRASMPVCRQRGRCAQVTSQSPQLALIDLPLQLS